LAPAETARAVRYDQIRHIDPPVINPAAGKINQAPADNSTAPARPIMKLRIVINTLCLPHHIRMSSLLCSMARPSPIIKPTAPSILLIASLCRANNIVASGKVLPDNVADTPVHEWDCRHGGIDPGQSQLQSLS
jgi:hypothetical protein